MVEAINPMKVIDEAFGENALNILKIEIRNRLNKRQELWEKIIALDGEVSGLREAEYQLEKLMSK